MAPLSQSFDERGRAETKHQKNEGEPDDNFYDRRVKHSQISKTKVRCRKGQGMRRASFGSSLPMMGVLVLGSARSNTAATTSPAGAAQVAWAAAKRGHHDSAQAMPKNTATEKLRPFRPPPCSATEQPSPRLLQLDQVPLVRSAGLYAREIAKESISRT